MTQIFSKIRERARILLNPILMIHDIRKIRAFYNPSLRAAREFRSQVSEAFLEEAQIWQGDLLRTKALRVVAEVDVDAAAENRRQPDFLGVVFDHGGAGWDHHALVSI